MTRSMTQRIAGLCALLAFIAFTISPAFAEQGAPKPIKPQKAIDLFNGKDLSNWTLSVGGKDKDPTQTFQAKDGLIKISGRPSGVMRTRQAYTEYEIEVQWRWPGKGGNAGLLIHSTKPNERNVWPKSLEVQIQSGQAGDFWVIGERVRVKDAQTRTKGRRTINYTDGSEKPLGEWNTMIVQARGDTVKVFVNGDLVNEAWDCSASAGAICLQSEGTPIEYRKVQIRPLSEN